MGFLLGGLVFFFSHWVKIPGFCLKPSDPFFFNLLLFQAFVVVVIVVDSVREFYFGVFLLLYFLVELLSSLFYFHWDFQGV